MGRAYAVMAPEVAPTVKLWDWEGYGGGRAHEWSWKVGVTLHHRDLFTVIWSRLKHKTLPLPVTCSVEVGAVRVGTHQYHVVRGFYMQ